MVHWFAPALTLLATLAAPSASAIEIYRTLASAVSAAEKLGPRFDKEFPAKQRIHVRLQPVASGFALPTDLRFLPDNPNLLIVLEKGGNLRWASLKNGTTGTIHSFEVHSGSELGLLGIAFHPDFKRNRKLYLNYNPKDSGPRRTRVSEWQLPASADPKALKLQSERILLEVEQPYRNHNGGQLQFGPDGYLYIGLGDGGDQGDPHGNGQNINTLLGSMLRIDVNAAAPGKPYGIPGDNPFVGKTGGRPEIWAWGFRNPWRYSFDEHGRLIVADVGERRWEEISIVERDKNYGWNVREGAHCFHPPAACSTLGLQDPVIEYDHSEPGTVIGGYVYTGKTITRLTGKYVYADYLTGRFWAAELPEKDEAATPVTPDKIHTLGRWSISPTAFTRDQSGELYVTDFSSGRIYKIRL